MVYKRQMPSRSLPPERLRIIERNQAAISKRNMAVDAGKSAYVRGKDNSLEERPPVKKGPMTPGKGRIGNDRYKKKPGNLGPKGMAERKAAIASNQRTLSARNMAVDAGKSAYVRGKNAGLVEVPKVIVRRMRPRKPGDRRA